MNMMVDKYKSLRQVFLGVDKPFSNPLAKNTIQILSVLMFGAFAFHAVQLALISIES